jgi:hypothetical protein
MNSDVVSSCFSPDFSGFDAGFSVVESGVRFATFNFSSAKWSFLGFHLRSGGEPALFH